MVTGREKDWNLEYVFLRFFEDYILILIYKGKRLQQSNESNQC